MKTYKVILPNGKTVKYKAEYFSKSGKDSDIYFIVSGYNAGIAPNGSAVFELDCQNTNKIDITEKYNYEIS